MTFTHLHKSPTLICRPTGGSWSSLQFRPLPTRWRQREACTSHRPNGGPGPGELLSLRDVSVALVVKISCAFSSFLPWLH